MIMKDLSGNEVVYQPRNKAQKVDRNMGITTPNGILRHTPSVRECYEGNPYMSEETLQALEKGDPIKKEEDPNVLAMKERGYSPVLGAVGNVIAYQKDQTLDEIYEGNPYYHPPRLIGAH